MPQGLEFTPGEKRVQLADMLRAKADRARMVPVSFAQQRLWFLSRLEPDGAAYNMSSPLRVRGPLDEASLRQTFNLLLARHEVLRGRFEVVEGQPVQVIAPRLTVDLPVVDLTAWPEAEREADVTRRLRAEAQRPFDLTQAPLLRVSLVRLAPHDHVLLLTLHHIVSDGWSMGILLREIAAIYAATVAARPVALPALPIQYADFARWQRGWLQGAVLAEQVGYWRGQLAGAPGVLDLPVARPRPAMQTMHGALVGRTLSPQVSRAVTDLSAREGVTVFMTLLATFQTLLYRYSGQEDFVVGSPIAGRDRAETEGLIGFFVNSLPLRANLAGNPSFRELLARVKETALGAYAHQGLPFERMVEELQPARSLSYPPIFQVMFALQNQPRVALTLPGLAIEPVASARDSAKFDLTLFMAERAGQLSCRLEYNTDLFAPDTATRLLQHFEVLLEGVTARPQQRVAALPLLPAAERERLLTTWNATAVALPAETGVHQRVEQQVARTADATAVVDAGTTTTYGELNRRANQLAHYLRTLGVGPEARVGIFMERSVEMIVALLGVLKAGGAYVPLDPTYPPERIRFSVADAQLAVILTDARWAATLPPSAARVVSVAAARAAGAGLSAANPVSDTVAGNLAYVIYTSGSTGQPKGVAITHGSALALVDWAGRTFTREELRGVLASTSICFDLSVFEIFVPLSVGGTVILAADALQLPVVAAQATVTLVNTVPSAMAELVRIGLPASVQTVNLAGEPLRPELVTQIYRQSAVTRVVDLYGPTEDTTYSTCAERAPDQPATIGRPIANTRAYILDGLLAPVPIGVPGELYLGGAGLARGYVGRPAATAERFLPDPFSRAPGQRLYRTGDIARYAADGTIEYLGRVDHQVKVRGYRIELGEIETVMGRHPGVRDTVVLAREDAPGDIRLVAYIVPAGSGDVAATNGSLSAGLTALLKRTLPAYMVPAHFVLLDAFPLTPNGKIDRGALGAPDRSMRPVTQSRVAPRDEMETQLAAIWARVLGVDSVGVDDTYFELGGHSLLAVRLMSDIEHALGQKIPLVSLFQGGTISALAAILRRGVTSIAWPTVVEIQPGGAKPALFCVSPPNVNALGYRSLARYLGPEQPVYGLQAQYPEDMRGEHSQAVVDELAAEYLEAMRAVQPAGPYQLLGQCRGAHIAFEIARRLNAEGQQTALVGILDTWVMENTLNALWYLKYSLSKLVSQGRKTMVNGIARILKPRPAGRDSATPKRDPAPEVYFPGAGFVPKTYSGRLAVFRARKQPRYRVRDKTLGWGTLVAGGVEVYVVPGIHSDVLSEPHVQSLADAISKCLLPEPAATPLATAALQDSTWLG